MHNHLQLPTLPAWLALLICLLPLTASGQGIDLTADHIARDEKGGVTASGNVLMRRGDETLQTDKLLYDPASKRMRADGNVLIRSPKATVEAESGELDTETKLGELYNATVIMPDGERLWAERLQRVDDDIFEANDPRFSACPPDQLAWTVAASHARLDQKEGIISATHGRFMLGELPVLYSPYWSHPLRRRSGFLVPYFADGKRRGTEFALPYFWAPAENWDTTITPHWMSDRGLQLGVEYRYISTNIGSFVYVEGLRDDITTRNRGKVSANIDAKLPLDTRLIIDANYVTDGDYLADFSPDPGAITTRYLQSKSTLSWQSELASWQLYARHIQDLAAVSNAATRQTVPHFESYLKFPVWGEQVLLHFDQATTRFIDQLGTDDLRLDVHPYVEIPWDIYPGGLDFTVSAGSRHTQYWLHDTDPLLKSRFARTSGEFSAEARAIFERHFSGEKLRHTIEPTLRYNLVNVKDQRSLPNFDSGFSGLTMTTLLSNNRFSGIDRIESVNRLAMLLTSRLQLKSAEDIAPRTLARVSIGALYDMRRHSVDPGLQTPPSQPLSNLFGEFDITPLPSVSLSGTAQFDTSDRFWANATATLNWQSSIHRLSVGYQFADQRFARPETRFIQFSGDLQLFYRWKLQGAWDIDINQQRTQQASMGVRYEHPCWDLLVEGYTIYHPTRTSTSSYDGGVRFLLGFKGLGTVGRRITLFTPTTSNN